MDDAVQEYDSATREWVTPAADPVVETPAAEPVVEEPAAAEPVAEVKPKPRNDPKARVEQATAKEAAAKRERDEAKAEAAKLQARIAELEARTAPKPQPVARPQAAPDAEPDPTDTTKYADGQFDRQYLKDQARWEARQELAQRDALQRQQAAMEARAQQVQAVDRQFSERYQAVLAKDPEFASKVDPRLLNTPRAGVLANPAEATFGNFLVEQVFQSEQPDVLLLHLSDPAVVQRLATLPPAVVIRELAKLEVSHGAASSAAPASKAPAISQAKAPIRPVGSSPLVSSDEPGDEASDEEWRRHWEAAELRKRRAGRG